VPAVSAADLILPAPAEGSANTRGARCRRARIAAGALFRRWVLPGLTTNAAAPAALIEDIARPDTARSNLVRDAA
jgi:magnesium chelatase family protein